MKWTLLAVTIGVTLEMLVAIALHDAALVVCASVSAALVLVWMSFASAP